LTSRIKNILTPLASLKFTIVLMVLALILIYAGTWAQIDAGIWDVQGKYFHSLITSIDPAVMVPRNPDGSLKSITFNIGDKPRALLVPLPGGYLVGLFLLLNLIAAHIVRFKFTWKRTGIILIHLGLILLLVGEGITSSRAVESRMTIEEGQTINFVEDTRKAELVIIDPSNPEHDDVTAIPHSMLEPGALIKHSALPMQIKIDEFYKNATFLGPFQAGAKANPRATAGIGAQQRITLM
jgi:hypothetical protein